MNYIQMVKYGRTLTDRAYGKKIAEDLVASTTFPVGLDFRSVVSLGSSFGDEIISAIGPRQGGRISVLNVNKAVKSCLKKVGYDSGIAIAVETGQ